MATEAEKILSRVRPHLDGKSVLEIGCGPEKIVPWALSADHYFKADMNVDVSPDSGQLQRELGGRQFDVVFSSHTIEHIRAPILETIKYWFSFVKGGGELIMYLPDESRYIFSPGNPLQRNPEHFHYLTPMTFKWYLDQVANMKPAAIEHDPVIHNRYSFLVIAGKS